jgi:hypothetical protein
MAMKVTSVTQQPNGWVRFSLSVGGFVVKGCRWLPASGGALFPQRYDTHGGVHRVVYAHGRLVKRLRALLASGEAQLPRDRRPCVLKPRFRGYSHQEWPQWIIFDFTVRGFTILGCRWQPQSGSIQLPVTFTFDEKLVGAKRRHAPYRLKRVVCAYGAHIVRLREALEACFHSQEAEPAEAEAVLAE